MSTVTAIDLVAWAILALVAAIGFYAFYVVVDDAIHDHRDHPDRVHDGRRLR
jgi:hypothetical protein